MDDNELLRYSRQIMISDVDVEGQEKIMAGNVAIVGVGGLGSPVAIYLASAGVGKLTLIDDDQVEVTNLPRQIAHFENDIGRLKVESAVATLSTLNPATEVEAVAKRLNEKELVACFEHVDVVVDATDNFSSRYANNRACAATQTPLVSGAAIQMVGQVTVFDYKNPESPCYQCLYRDGLDEELNCAENGVLGPVVGTIGTFQAMEVLKILGGFGTPLINKVLYIDFKRMDVRSLRLSRDPDCPACGIKTTE